MTNLIQKLFGKKEKIPVRTRLSADEIKPLFESIGIDIENIGFPEIGNRYGHPLDRYNINFDKVRVTPIAKNDTLQNIVTGDYLMRAQTSYKDSSGGWHPGTQVLYSFKIEDGKLYLGDEKIL